jgi:hypothetical protein
MASKPVRAARGGVPAGHTPVYYLERPGSGQQAVVVGTVHIGEREYYRRLDRLIQSFPGMIFYEDTQGRLFDYSRVDRYTSAVRETLLALKAIGEMQGELARSLRLQHQLDGIRYQPDWIRADIDFEEIVAALSRRRSVLHVMGRLPPQLMRLPNHFLARALVKYALQHASQMAGLVDVYTSRDRGFAYIVNDRNERALEIFDREIGERHGLFIYGYGHAKGLLEGLDRRGYRLRDTEFYAYLHDYPLAEHLVREGLHALWETFRA